MMSDWLARTREIQISAYKRDPQELSGAAQAEFIRWNILATVAELMEALEETRWKTWAVPPEDEPVIPNKAILASELADAMMFIANTLVTSGISDDDFETIYRAKWQKNIERQERAGGYQSRRGEDKCVECNRSFDDVGRAVSDAMPGHCAICEKETAE